MLKRLILIDRTPGRQDPLEEILRSDFDVVRFESLEQAVRGIPDLLPHGILIIIKDEHPEETLRALRSQELSRELPLIVVSPTHSPQREALAFQSGADDFITTDSDPVAFRARLTGILRYSFSMRRLRSKLAEMDFFVRTVTHDLKNPIGSILSYAELLGLALDTGDLNEARSLVETIQKSTNHALEFLQDLLSLLRHGVPLRQVEEVPAEDVIRGALAELELKIRQTGAVIRLPPRLPRILCDRRRMAQVFTNLFSNAMKYVEKGVAPRIAVNLIETPHANTFVVADNGIGMDPRDTRKIFQAFVRLPEAADYEGTGLGLSIVQRIVDAHEGDVFARSRKGMGTEVYVVLPTKLSFIPSPQTARPTPAGATTPPAPPAQTAPAPAAPAAISPA